MKKVTTSDIERFLFDLRVWQVAEQSEDCIVKGNGQEKYFYNQQLQKLKSLGFPVEGGLASQIARTCSPSRCIGVVWTACVQVEQLMRYGFTYVQAAQFLIRLYEGVSSAPPSAQNHAAAAKVFLYFGGDVTEPEVQKFFSLVVPGILIVLRQFEIRGPENRKRFRVALRQCTPTVLPVNYPERAVGDSEDFFRVWLQRCVTKLLHMFGSQADAALLMVWYYLHSAACRKTEHHYVLLNFQDEMISSFHILGIPLQRSGLLDWFDRVIPLLKGLIEEQLSIFYPEW